MKKLIYSKEDLDLILTLELEEKNKEIERLNSAMRLKMDKILTFITDFCESCSSHEECPEEECVLWMVEQVVLEEIGKGLEEDGRE